MIFYFSGTGNSKFVASHINKKIEDEVLSINKLIKEDGNKVFTSKKPFVLVVPTYAWRIPRVVEEFIQKSSFEGSQKVYVIMTCGEDTQNGVGWARKLFSEKSLELVGFAEIVLPNNYLFMNEPLPNFKEAQGIIKAALPRIDEIRNLIAEGKGFMMVPSHGVKGKLQSSIANSLFYSLLVKSKGFLVDEKCNGCKKCNRICPLNNISIVDGKPSWDKDCTHCMACIARCPKNDV
jgi:flavodoxin/ferredoxin